MIFHEPALADLDALALDDEARALSLRRRPAGSSKEGRGACLPGRAGASRMAGLVPATDERAAARRTGSSDGSIRDHPAVSAAVVRLPVQA